MTKKEAFLELAIGFHVAEKSVTGALLEAGIIGEEEFIAGGLSELEKASIPLLQRLMFIKQESEGQYTIIYDTAKISELLAYLSGKYGIKIPTGQPKIRGLNNIW